MTVKILNVKEFNNQLDAFRRQVDVDLTELIKLAALKAFTGIVKKTPIKTGVARGSWVIGIGKWAAPYIAPPGLTEAEVLARSVAIQTAAKGTKLITLVNAVPYSPFLEKGHSKQAPSGMVGLTLWEVANELKAVTK